MTSQRFLLIVSLIKFSLFDTSWLHDMIIVGAERKTERRRVDWSFWTFTYDSFYGTYF